MGKSSKITILAVDDIKETIDAIRQGLIWGTLAQNFIRMGYESGAMIMEHLDGKPVPKSVPLDALLITKDNVYTYEAELWKAVKKK